jgi:hypothetical protein
MNKFKAGDKVKRIGKPFGSVKVGDIETVETVRGSGSIELVDHFHVYDPKYFELVQDEKESTSAWLKENKWFIRTGSVEKSKLVQEWLFEHGCEWLCGKGKTVQSDFKDQLLTNTNCVGYKEKYIMFSTDGNKTNAQEITLEFETVVKSVKLPEAPKPTEQESQQKLRIIELEATISKAQEQVAKLKEEIK